MIVSNARIDKNMSYVKIGLPHFDAAAPTGSLQNVMKMKSVAALYMNRRSSSLKIRASEA